MTSSGEQTGRTLSGTAYTLGYDYDGQLTSITQGSNTTSFAYDALGRRYSRTSGGVLTVFYWGLRGLDLQEYSTGGVTFFGGGELDFDAWGNGHAEYPCFDGLGSERVGMDYTGQSVLGTISYNVEDPGPVPETFGRLPGRPARR